LPFVDDGGVVRVVGQCRVKTAKRLAVGLDETLDAIFRHQHVVRRHAGLPGVQGLAEGDAFGGVLEGHIGGNDRRRFAAQFQRDRGQMLGRRAHHMFTDAGGAGEQQMIEAQPGKCHADVGLAQHHAHQVFGEDLRQQGLEQFAGGRGRFAEFEHHPVARGQRAHQWPDGQVQRVVPGHDHPDHAQRLVDDFGRGGLEGDAYSAAGRFHPATEVFARIVNAMQAGHQFGEQGFVGAAMAEVLADRIDQRLAFVAEHFAQGLEPLLALRGRRHRVGGIGAALGVEQALELIQCLGILRVGNVGRHGAVPDCYWSAWIFRVIALNCQMALQPQLDLSRQG